MSGKLGTAEVNFTWRRIEATKTSLTGLDPVSIALVPKAETNTRWLGIFPIEKKTKSSREEGVENPPAQREK